MMAGWSEGECADLEELLEERLQGMLEPGERVRVSGETGGQEVQARFVLEGGRTGARLELESRVELGGKVKSLERARDLAVDALDLVLLEYLESERSIRYSGAWQQRELQGAAVAVRVERTFPGLEAQADALLDKKDGEPA